MIGLRPFLLRPSLAERVWGGWRFGEGIGEAWDLSVHPNGLSTVASGPYEGSTLADLAAEHPDAFGGPIELLAKRLDCSANLSVQVHPTEGDPKTEAWVVLDAEPGAGVYLGFRAAVTAEMVAEAAADGSLPELLCFVDVEVGQALLVPAGTVHAVGAGLVLLEVQQCSDSTYRLFDWGREGRELHLDAGLACAHLGPAEPQRPPRSLGAGVSRLVECDDFVVDEISAAASSASSASSVPVDPGHRWAAVHLLSGSAWLDGIRLRPGDTCVVPRTAPDVELRADGPMRAVRYGPPLQ